MKKIPEQLFNLLEKSLRASSKALYLLGNFAKLLESFLIIWKLL